MIRKKDLLNICKSNAAAIEIVSGEVAELEKRLLFLEKLVGVKETAKTKAKRGRPRKTDTPKKK